MRLRKKILSLLLIVVGIWSFSSFLWIWVSSPVYAETSVTNSNATTVDKKTTLEEDFRNLADIFLKLGYIILWPLILLSGLALDNTMVYGEIFHMDAPLRQFRNICKNFANFGLWFMILYEILKSIFTLAGAEKPMKVIQKAIIAGILIQMSWFIVAALVDISTIATYAVWGMPMSILKTDNSMKNTKILQPNVSMNINSVKKIESSDFIVSYQVKTSSGTIYLSPCMFKNDSKDQRYIVGREYGDLKFQNQGKLVDKDNKPIDPKINACVNTTENTVTFFNEFPDLVGLSGSTYKTALGNILGAEQRNVREACGYIIKLGNNTPTTTKCSQDAVTAQNIQKDLQKRYNEIKENKIDKDAGKTRFEQSAATSIGQVIDKSKWFVGPLATIYTSLMDFANLSNITDTNGSVWKGIGEVILRTAIAAWLIFPLLALTVVLIIRIGFLRCIIATSPIIILIKSFDLWGKIGDIGKQIDIVNIIKVVFAPVITVFALSMGLIFLTALMSTYKNTPEGSQNTIMAGMGISQTKWTAGDTYDTMNIFGTILKYPKSMNTYAGATGDWFSWMLLCFSGIGIMWFILFAAIGASGTIWAAGKAIKEFGENAIKTAPIPIPWIGKVGIGTLGKEAFGANAGENLTKMRDNSKFVNMNWKGWQNDLVNDALIKIGARESGEDKTVTKLNQLVESNNYEDIGKTITGDEKKMWTEDIMGAISSNKNIDTWLKALDESKRDTVLDKLKVKEKYYQKEATEAFEWTIWKVANKAELETLIKTEKATNLAKLYKGYKKDIKTTDGKEYIITEDAWVFKITDKPTSPSTSTPTPTTPPATTPAK